MFSDEAFDTDLNDPIATHLRTIREGHSSSNPGTTGPKIKATQWNSDDEEEPRNTRREVQMKTVRFTPPNPAPQKSTIDKVKELARKMHGLDIGDISYSGCYTHLICLTLAAAQAWTPPKARQQGQGPPQYPSAAHPYPPQGDLSCFFCGLPHLIHNCPTAAEYIRIGHVIQENNFFLYPDHSRI